MLLVDNSGFPYTCPTQIGGLESVARIPDRRDSLPTVETTGGKQRKRWGIGTAPKTDNPGITDLFDAVQLTTQVVVDRGYLWKHGCLCKRLAKSGGRHMPDQPISMQRLLLAAFTSQNRS